MNDLDLLFGFFEIKKSSAKGSLKLTPFPGDFLLAASHKIGLYVCPKLTDNFESWPYVWISSI